MGDMFTSSKATQTTTNRQVGVQGTGALGISGNIGAGSFGGQSTTIRAAKGSTVQLQTSDFGAINAARDTQLAALSANQTISLASLGSQQSVAEQAINASNQATINALDVVRSQANRQSDITEVAVGAAQDVAKQAAPGGNIKYSIGSAIILAAIAVVYLKNK